LDELALEFDVEFARVSGLVADVGSSSAAVALLALDEQLARMSGPEHAELWMPEALAGDEWATVRELAGAALRELDD
jgi:hypothetical protein